MKLGLLTYNVARDWDLEKLIEVSKKLGYAGIEFRVDSEHKHGVEIDSSKKARKEIKNRLEDAYLEAIGIGTSSRFESSEKSVRRENIERAKKCVELASDIDAKYVRVFGNQFQAGSDREEVVRWVGEALTEINEFAKPYKVEALLEMHGDFNFWKYTLKALELSNIPGAGLVYNCDKRDMIGNSIKPTYSRVRHLIKHVHMHALIGTYPYKEFLQLLKDDGYDGYLSAEIDGPTSDAETVLAYYSALYYEMVSNLK